MVKRIVKPLLLAAVMAFIFMMSAQPGAESLDTSNSVVDLIYRLYMAVGKLSHDEFVGRYLPFIRKMAHFCEFMAMGFFAYLNSEEFLQKRIVLYSALLVAIYAISDEIHQLFVANRYCSVGDMLIDSMGGMTGILLCYLIVREWRKRRQ